MRGQSWLGFLIEELQPTPCKLPLIPVHRGQSHQTIRKRDHMAACAAPYCHQTSTCKDYRMGLLYGLMGSKAV